MINLLLQTVKNIIKDHESIDELNKKIDKLSNDVIQLSTALSALAHIVNKHNYILNEAMSITTIETEKKMSSNLDLPEINPEKYRKPN